MRSPGGRVRRRRPVDGRHGRLARPQGDPGREGARVRRHHHEDVLESIFLFSSEVLGLLRDLTLDLGVRHHDLALHFALTQALDREFIANVFPEPLEVDPVPLKALAELGHRDVVLVGHAHQGLFQGDVIDLDAVFLGERELHLVVSREDGPSVGHERNAVRQEQQRHTKSIQALRTSLWHRFQERVEVLQKFGYLTLTTQLTEEGEWARLIRIDHSLLITELIRAEAFTGADPSLLAGILASLAHDDDRPGAFPRISPGLSSLLGQVRKLAESLSPYEDPPLLRADVAALVERWVADPTLTWIGLCRLTTMAEGDIYRLLARTLEYLSQVQTLNATHPGLAESASHAITSIRRGVLEELP